MHSGRLGVKHIREPVARTASTLKITLNFKDHFTFRFFPNCTIRNNLWVRVLPKKDHTCCEPMFILRYQPFYFRGKADWVIWHDFLSSSNTVHYFQITTPAILTKNVPAETTEHKLGLVGVLTRTQRTPKS